MPASLIADMPHLQMKTIGSREEVLQEKAARTRYGLAKHDLVRIRGERIISIKEQAKQRGIGINSLTKWNLSTKAARWNLGIIDFRALRKGTPLYNETKRIHRLAGFEWLREVRADPESEFELEVELEYLCTR